MENNKITRTSYGQPAKPTLHARSLSFCVTTVEHQVCCGPNNMQCPQVRFRLAQKTKRQRFWLAGTTAHSLRPTRPLFAEFSLCRQQVFPSSQPTQIELPKLGCNSKLYTTIFSVPFSLSRIEKEEKRGKKDCKITFICFCGMLPFAGIRRKLAYLPLLPIGLYWVGYARPPAADENYRLECCVSQSFSAFLFSVPLLFTLSCIACCCVCVANIARNGSFSCFGLDRWKSVDIPIEKVNFLTATE